MLKPVGDNKNLIFILILSTNDCRFYPDHAGTLGKGKVDMSALDNGVYEFSAEATPATCSFSYTSGPEGSYSWITDEPVVISLKKDGDVFTQTVTAISTIAVDEQKGYRTFDLHCRELQSIPKHRIYIQNVKKHVK